MMISTVFQKNQCSQGQSNMRNPLGTTVMVQKKENDEALHQGSGDGWRGKTL